MAGIWQVSPIQRADSNQALRGLQQLLGRIFYTKQDYTESLIWFNRAAEAGHARSIYWVGRHHWYGQSVPQDRKEAMRFFHVAASKKVVAARRVLKFLARRKYADA